MPRPVALRRLDVAGRAVPRERSEGEPGLIR